MAGREPRCVGTDVVFDGRKVRLEVHQVEAPGGRRTTREIVRHPGSVAVLAFRRGADGGREVLLERNWRYTVGRYVTEIPAGTLDRAGEPPIECARRELAEETGFVARDLAELVAIMPSPGLLTERLTVFVAEDVEQGQASPEPGELIDTLWVPWAEALRRVREKSIEDAKTVVAILYYDAFGSRSDS